MIIIIMQKNSKIKSWGGRNGKGSTILITDIRAWIQMKNSFLSKCPKSLFSRHTFVLYGNRIKINFNF